MKINKFFQECYFSLSNQLSDDIVSVETDLFECENRIVELRKKLAELQEKRSRLISDFYNNI